MSKKDTVKNEQMIQENQEKVTIIDSGVSTLGKMIDIVKNNSLWTLFKTFIVAIFFGLLAFIILNPTYIFEKYQEFEDKKHSEELAERFDRMEELNGSRKYFGPISS